MIQIKDLNKTYGEGANAVHALRNCNVEFEYGKFTAIIGTSGSGKSTLLHLMGGLDTKAEGEIFYDDEDILRYSDAQLAKFRRKKYRFRIPVLQSGARADSKGKYIPANDDR